ncbi:MAG: NAD-dependent epimerase/dehydratase family protein, partial [Deltaproteobacteria bacterium]|nr:NAD-dependent epimerase/dehydratase family protein [Deltaproteobacteria bacterium]
QAAQAAGSRRFVHISAGAVLTGGRPVINADETWEVPGKPIGAYAQTKALGEKFVLESNSKNFSTVILRPPCIWGTGDQAMLPGMIDAIRSGKWVWIDQGKYFYSTCHVNNVCEAILLACDKGQGGEVYFIADGPPATFRDFFSELIRTQRIEPGNMSIPGWTARLLAPLMEKIWTTFNLKGYPPVSNETVALFLSPISIVDNKARSILGYRGLYTRQQGMADLRKAHRNN